MRYQPFAFGPHTRAVVSALSHCAVFVPFALSAVACSAILDASAYHVSAASDDAGTLPDAAPVVPPCATTEECVQRIGEYAICRKSDHVCVPLQSPDCTRVVGDYKNDNAIFIGSLLPTAGADQTTGIPTQNAIELAMDDFRKSGNIPPRPGANERRPLVMVACNDASEDDVAVRAARHLTSDVQVPAIIGAAFSGITIKVATEVTIPGNVLLISPSATSVAITQLDDNGLVWRTSPSDVIQADAHAALLPLIEAEILARPVPVPSIRVAIAHKGDTYGAGLAQALVAKVSFNKKPAIDPANTASLRVLDYGDPGDMAKPPDYAGTIQKIIRFVPHVVYLLGTTESITEMLAGIEAVWQDPVRPIYLLADGAFIPEATTYLQDKDKDPPADEKRKRIFGTVPGTNNANYQTFRILYGSSVRDGTSADISGTANAYDALYNLAFAAAALGDKPVTGPNLATGFARQVPPGTPIKVGAANINTALQHLLGGGSIDFDGASGPLDYDLTTGEASSDIQIWCIPKVDNNVAPPKNSGTFYNASTKKLEGTLAGARAGCGI